MGDVLNAKEKSPGSSAYRVCLSLFLYAVRLRSYKDRLVQSVQDVKCAHVILSKYIQGDKLSRNLSK